MCASDCPMREYGTGGGGRGARTALHGKPPTAFVGAVRNEVGPGYDPAAGSTHLRRRRAIPARLCSNKAEFSCWRTTTRPPCGGRTPKQWEYGELSFFWARR